MKTSKLTKVRGGRWTGLTNKVSYMRKCGDSSQKVYEHQRGWPTKAQMGF